MINPQNNNLRCSVVIRCHNEEEHIGKLLTGIGQQTLSDVEIILVDSGSTDATLAIASRYPIKILTINRDEFSFGRSLNLGCGASTSDYIVIVSAHIYPVAKDWLEKLLKPFSDPQVALVYGRQRGDEQTKYSEQKVLERWFPQQSNLRQKHPFCNNANVAIRRDLWQRLPYNEELTGLEDLDWAKRAISLGHCIAYVADAEIVHVHEETPQRLYNRYRREAIALKRIFSEEHFRLFDFLRLFSANVITDYYHAWHDKILLKNLREIPLFRLMQFWGTYRGFAYQGTIASRLKQTFYYPTEMTRKNNQTHSADPSKIIDYSIHHSEMKIERPD